MMTGRVAFSLCLAIAPLLGCADEPGSHDGGTSPDAAADAPPAVPADAAAGADVGPDAATDPATDAAPESTADLPADAAPDLASDGAPDVSRPGILSVPADDPDIKVTNLILKAGRDVPAYLATPSRTGTFAGILVVPDPEQGLTDHLRDVARRLAKTGGCVALVPDVGAGELESVRPELDAALAALAGQPQVGAHRLGALGFGAGATRALLFAAANLEVRAVVAYYGATPAPADVMKTTGAAILGQYAASDDAVNAGIPDLERVLKEAGKVFEKRSYPAPHGFNDDTAPGYDEAAAVAAWPFTVGWFEVYVQ